MDPILGITLVALVFSAVSIFLNHKVGGRKKVKELQKEVNDFQKNFEKATKEKDEKEIQRLKNIEPEVMKKMQEMLLLPIKSMVIILPLFFIVIAGIEYFFHGFSIVLPIGIHPNEIFALKLLEPSTYGPRGFFIFTSIIFNLVLEFGYSNIVEKMLKANKEKPQPPK